MVFVTILVIMNGARLVIVEGQAPLTIFAGLTTPALVAAVFGGIPIGFLVYQLYYAGYRAHSRKATFTLFLRRDRGAQAILEYLDLGGSEEVLDRIAGCRDLPVPLAQQIRTAQEKVRERGPLRLLLLSSHLCGGAKSSSWRRCSACASQYEANFVRNWQLYQLLIDLTSTHREFSAIKYEYVTGSDLYHALGATRRAVSLASLAAVALAFTPAGVMGLEQVSAAGAGSVAWLLATIAAGWGGLWLALTRCRRNTDASYRRRVAAYLALITREFPDALWTLM